MSDMLRRMRERDAELAQRRAELEAQAAQRVAAEAVGRMKAPEHFGSLAADTVSGMAELAAKRDERFEHERVRRERERLAAQEAREAAERAEAPLRARLRDALSVSAMARVPGPIARFVATDDFDPSVVAVQLARNWASEDAERGLILRGGVGNGKSVAAACAAAQYAQQCGYAGDISWHRPNDFASGMLHAYDAKAPKVGDGLVVIDDIGRETKADFVEALVVLIDDRLTRFVLTTNLTIEELEKRYGERLVDRLHHECQIVALSGNSRRRRGA